MRLKRLAAGIASVVLGLVSGACSGPSVWQQSFVRSPDVAAQPSPKAAPVRVRSIPWDRMHATQDDLRALSVADDVHPQDWAPERKLDARTRLLRGLQVGADPASTEVVGVCEFRTTDSIIPDGEDRAGLEAFARSVGATDVVWSSRSLGKADKIVDKPVTTVSTGTYWADRRRADRDRFWSDNYTQNSTTWVPVRIQAEETGFVFYFLRTPPQ